uniref:Head-tail adaptor n=1 Tax=Acinetobacter phage vB_AbaSt_W16 TaxID=3116434 RepID=A0AB38ZCZ2_9CAUD
MFTQPKTPKQLKDDILMRLGAPIIQVEVTEAQIYQCIQRALELYGEYHYNGLNKTYIAIHIGDDDQYKNGVFDLSDENIFAVSQIIRGNTGLLLTLDGSATYSWASDFILGMAGVNGCNSGTRAFGPNGFGANLSYYTTIMQYWSILQNMFNPIPDFWFNDDTGQLKLSGNFKKGDLIFLEVWVKSFVDTNYAVGSYAGYGYAQGEQNPWSVSDRYNNANYNVTGYIAGESQGTKQGAFNNRWVKDYATVLVKELNGQILAKHQGMQLAGGTTVDGVRLIEEARLEKERLIDELDSLAAPPGILMG